MKESKLNKSIIAQAFVVHYMSCMLEYPEKAVIYSIRLFVVYYILFCVFVNLSGYQRYKGLVVTPFFI